jgi:hypothetical protein
MKLEEGQKRMKHQEIKTVAAENRMRNFFRRAAQIIFPRLPPSAFGL